jgi:hypothetical protein
MILELWVKLTRRTYASGPYASTNKWTNEWVNEVKKMQIKSNDQYPYGEARYSGVHLESQHLKGCNWGRRIATSRPAWTTYRPYLKTFHLVNEKWLIILIIKVYIF